MKKIPAAQRRQLKTEWTVLCAMQLLVAMIFAWTLYDERVDIQRKESERLEAQARVVEDNVLRQIEGASKALDGVRDGLAHLELDPATQASALDAQLKLLTGAMPGVSSMLVLDAQGTIVASSRVDLVGKNFRQRDYFDVPRRTGDVAMLYVSPPFKSSVGSFVTVVSRTLTNSRGEFAGVVTATLDPNYFAVVLRAVLYAPDMQTSLAHGNGQVFLTAPPTTPEFAGEVVARPSSAATQRLVATRKIQRDDLKMNAPMMATVSRDLRALYLPWRDKALQLTLVFLVLALGSAALLFLNQRRRQALGAMHAELVRERELATERVELALRGADLGLWDLRLPDEEFVINARERELLGFGPHEVLPRGAGWRELIHPDDRAAVAASMLPHLRGEAPAYECEHRMRHRDGHYLWLSNRAMIVERDAAGAPRRIIGTHLDVTERKHTEAQLALSAALLRDSEEQMRQITDNVPALVSRLDRDHRFRFVNRAYAEWLNVKPEEIIGRSLAELYGEAAYAAFRHRIEVALAGERVVYEREMSTSRGPRRVEVTLVPQRAGDGTVQGLYTLIVDITERFEAEARLRQLAEFDALTGLPNRSQFQSKLPQAMQRAAPARQMALLFLDVDHFKTINDTLGHEAGDSLLKIFARRMQGVVRQSDTVARLGGDEFTVILEGLRDGADAGIVAGNLVEALREPILLGSQRLVVTASIGMTLCVPGEIDDAELLRRADAALYEAKRRGRDRFYCNEARAVESVSGSLAA